MVLKVQLISLFCVDMQDSVEEVLMLLNKLLGELHFLLFKKIYFQLQNESEQIYLKLLLQRLENLSVDEKNSKHLQKILIQKQFENSWEVKKRNPSVELEESHLEEVLRKPVALAKTFLAK